MQEREDGVRKVQILGAELSYVERGQGPTLLLVHGSLSDYRTWSAQIRFFSKEYRVIACSLRYHYPNLPPGGDACYSPMRHADDLASLLDTLHAAPAHIVASSYGAYAALFLAVRHAASVRSLVLGEPPVLPLLRRTEEGIAIWTRFMTEAWEPSLRSIQAGDADAALRYFVDGVMGKGRYDALPAATRASMRQNLTAKAAEVLTPPEEHFPDLPTDEAKAIPVGTLLLTGESSATMFHRITDELEARLPGCERAVIPGASHAMHANNPGAYNRLVHQFLTRQP